MENELTLAQAVIREGARKWFTELREGHTDQHFYAFAFGFHDDFVGPSLWANSLEFLHSRCDPDDEEFSWNPGLWEYSDSPDEAWQALSKYQENERNEVDDEALRCRRWWCLAPTALSRQAFTASNSFVDSSLM